MCVCCSIYLLRKESSTKKGVCGDVGCGVVFVKGGGVERVWCLHLRLRVASWFAKHARTLSVAKHFVLQPQWQLEIEPRSDVWTGDKP